MVSALPQRPESSRVLYLGNQICCMLLTNPLPGCQIILQGEMRMQENTESCVRFLHIWLMSFPWEKGQNMNGLTGQMLVSSLFFISAFGKIVALGWKPTCRALLRVAGCRCWCSCISEFTFFKNNALGKLPLTSVSFLLSAPTLPILVDATENG